jgi:hypothetical protein
MGLQFKIVFKQGRENRAADALSRVGHLMSHAMVSVAKPMWVQDIVNSYITDPAAQDLLRALAVRSPNDKGYSLQGGLIKKDNKIWVAQNTAIQTKIIAAFHSSALGGHSGVQATYLRVNKLFCWKGLKQDVESYVQQCLICQQAKHELVNPPGLLQPLPIPKGAWQDITMDFIEGLPKSDKSDTILVVVDRFSKYAHFIPLHHPFSAQSVAQVVFDQVVKLHGLPTSIVSDRDKIFTANFWTALMQLMGIKLTMSSAYHPQTDGQSERVNQCLEMFLRCAIHNSPKKWKQWPPQAELWYNTNYHSSLCCSPFKALYGYDPNVIAAPVDTPVANLSVEEWVKERELQNQALRQSLLAAQNRIKNQADKRRTDREFQVGEQVLLKLQPYVQSTVVSRPCPKLALKFFGPYKVLARIGKAAYKVELPEGAQIHNTFHVSQLKPFTPDYTPVYKDLPQVVDLEHQELQPERVLQRRLVKKGNNAVPQWLIKWNHLPEDSATWEDANVVQRRFPLAPAWGQAGYSAGDTVTPAEEAHQGSTPAIEEDGSRN